MLWHCGVKLEVEGAAKIAPGGSFVFVANHRSYLDSPIVLRGVMAQFRFLAANAIFYWPLIGFHLRRSGHLPVHYENPRASLKSMAAAARVIQQRGISILVFPEAGRTRGELEPFKDGAAYIAIKAGVPAVPVGILGSLEALPTGAVLIRPGVVKVRIGEPVPTLDMTLGDRTRLTQLLWVRVAELIGHPVPEERRELVIDRVG